MCCTYCKTLQTELDSRANFPPPLKAPRSREGLSLSLKLLYLTNQHSFGTKEFFWNTVDSFPKILIARENKSLEKRPGRSPYTKTHCSSGLLSTVSRGSERLPLHGQMPLLTLCILPLPIPCGHLPQSQEGPGLDHCSASQFISLSNHLPPL